MIEPYTGGQAQVLQEFHRLGLRKQPYVPSVFCSEQRFVRNRPYLDATSKSSSHSNPVQN